MIGETSKQAFWGSGVREELYEQENVDWTEGAGMEFPKVLLSPDTEVWMCMASLTMQACLFSLPQKFCSSNFIYTYCSMFLRPFTGCCWLLVQTNEYFPTQSLQLRL